MIACANDTDDNTSNSIEVLSRQIAELADRITLVEKNLKQSTLPKVLSVETYDKEVWEENIDFSKNVADYEFDNQGRIIKITERYTSEDGTDTSVTNVTYDENKCTLEYSTSFYTNRVSFTFDDHYISNISAVNNLIVSVFTDRQ